MAVSRLTCMAAGAKLQGPRPIAGEHAALGQAKQVLGLEPTGADALGHVAGRLRSGLRLRQIQPQQGTHPGRVVGDDGAPQVADALASSTAASASRAWPARSSVMKAGEPDHGQVGGLDAA